MTARETAPKSKAPAKGKAKPAAKAVPTAEKKAASSEAKAEKAATETVKASKASAEKIADQVEQTAKETVTETIAAAPRAAAETIQKGSDIMANNTEKMTDQTTKIMGDMSERAKAASEKTTQMMTQAGEFGRGNVEAFVEAGKIGTEGVQEMGRDNMEFAKKSFETASSSMKDFTSVKSPTELFQLQGEYARKNFDVMVEQASKNTEKMVKLFGDMFQPISNRMAEAGDKMKIEA